MSHSAIEVSVVAKKIITGDYELLINYLEQDGDPNARYDGYTLLALAAKHGNEVAAQFLIDEDSLLNSRSGDKKNTPLLLAIKHNHGGVANLLLRDDRCNVNAANSSGITPLLVAARNNMLTELRQLLKRGARTEIAAQATGHTALTIAVAKGNTDAVELLLDYGANPEHKIKDGKEAKDLAWDLSDSGPDGSKRAIIELLVKNENKRNECKNAIGAKSSELIKDRYRVIKIIGSGSFGSVLLVRDESDDGNGAIKAIKTIPMPESVDSWTEIEEGRHEAELMKRLNHPGVVGVQDYFDLEHKYCIVIDYCDLGDLSVWISAMHNAEMQFRQGTVVHWFLQLLLALDYLHSNKIMHRDLKPKNIFLRSDAIIKIGDFGLSRRLLNSTDYASTFAGTYKYLSPEVLNGQSYDYKSDIWALGCTLYELCTCSSLFRGQQAQVKEQITKRKITELPTSYSDELNKIFVEDLMNKSRRNRASAADLLRNQFIRQNLQEMNINGMADDEEFLRQNRNVVFKNEDLGFSDSDTFDTTMCDHQSSTLRTVITDLLKNEAAEAGLSSDPDDAGSKTIFDEFYPLLKRREKAGFPLSKVTALLKNIMHESSTKKTEELLKITKDLQTCELVEMLLVAEQSVNSSDDG